MKEFFVPGIPVPKGSAKAFYHKAAKRIVVMQDNRERQKPWASLISLMAQESGLTPKDGGFALCVTFFMPRPKSHLLKNGIPKPSAPPCHVSTPDLDKLIRCVKDALTGVAWEDDSQVTVVHAHKTYQEQHASNQPGAMIRVESV